MPFRKSELRHLSSIASTMKFLLTDYDSSPKAYRNYQKDNLKMMCRWLEKLMTPRLSKAAVARAKEIDIGIDADTLRNSNWFHQKTVLKDPKRKIFHLEHIKPVSQLANEVLEARNETIEKIEAILHSAEIAWILKDEDKKLTVNKYRTKRVNPYECYRLCGIELIEE